MLESWTREQRLPTDEEIARHRGWPEVDLESRIRHLFIQQFRPQVESFLEENGLFNYDLTDFKIDNLVGLFYGVYFYNLIAHGRIFSSKLSSIYHQFLTKNKLTPSSRQLTTWPTTISQRSSHSNAVSKGWSKYIEVYLENVDDFPPSDICEVHDSASIWYTDFFTYWVTIGLEEASHSDFQSLEKRHFPSTDTESRPLVMLTNAATTRLETIDKYALDSREFAATIVIATYIRRYAVPSWNHGFEAYYHAVRQKRKKALALPGLN